MGVMGNYIRIGHLFLSKGTASWPFLDQRQKALGKNRWLDNSRVTALLFFVSYSDTKGVWPRETSIIQAKSGKYYICPELVRLSR